MEDELILEHEETGTKLINLENFDPENFDNTVYIGGEEDFYGFEESKHKNPYSGGKSSAREAQEKYKTHFYRKIVEDDDYLEEVMDLKGKTLLSWMYPEHDHGEVIVNFIVESEKEDFDLKEHILNQMDNLDTSCLGIESLEDKEFVEENLRN